MQVDQSCKDTRRGAFGVGTLHHDPAGTFDNTVEKVRQAECDGPYISFLDELLGFLGLDGLYIVLVKLVKNVIPSATNVTLYQSPIGGTLTPETILWLSRSKPSPGQP